MFLITLTDGGDIDHNAFAKPHRVAAVRVHVTHITDYTCKNICRLIYFCRFFSLLVIKTVEENRNPFSVPLLQKLPHDNLAVDAIVC